MLRLLSFYALSNVRTYAVYSTVGWFFLGTVRWVAVSCVAFFATGIGLLQLMFLIIACFPYSKTQVLSAREMDMLLPPKQEWASKVSPTADYVAVEMLSLMLFFCVVVSRTRTASIYEKNKLSTYVPSFLNYSCNECILVYCKIHSHATHAGAHLWQLKDRIDRDWMRGYQELPTMEEMAASMRLKKMQQQQQQLDKDKGKGVTGGALSGASQVRKRVVFNWYRILNDFLSTIIMRHLSANATNTLHQVPSV